MARLAVLLLFAGAFVLCSCTGGSDTGQVPGIGSISATGKPFDSELIQPRNERAFYKTVSNVSASILLTEGKGKKARKVEFLNGQISEVTELSPQSLTFSLNEKEIILSQQSGIFEQSNTSANDVVAKRVAPPVAKVESYCINIATTGYQELLIETADSGFSFVGVSENKKDLVGGLGTIHKTEDANTLNFVKEGFGYIHIDKRSPMSVGSFFYRSKFKTINPGPWSSITEMYCHLNNVPVPVTNRNGARFLSARTAEDKKVSLQWEAPQGNSVSFEYKIYRATQPGVAVTDPLIATTSNLFFVDNNVVNGTRYFYRVVSNTAQGDSEPSNEADAIPIAPSAIQDLKNLFVDFAAPAGGNGSYLSPLNNLASAVSIAHSQGIINIFDGAISAPRISLTKSLTIRSLTGDFRNSNVIMSASNPSAPASGAFIIPQGVHDVSIKGLEFTGYSEGQGVVGQANVGGVISPSDRFNFSQNYIHEIPTFVLNRIGTFGSSWTVYGNKVKNVQGVQKTAFNLWSNSPLNELSILSFNEIDTTTFGGIQLDSTHFWVIRNNTITNASVHGIQVAAASSYVTIKANQVSCLNFSPGDTPAAIRLHTPSALLGPLTIEGNTLSAYEGLSISAGNDITGKAILVTGNSFIENTHRGIYHGGSGKLNAIGNYWNSSVGPQVIGDSSTSLGGDILEGLVDYLPFLISPPEL